MPLLLALGCLTAGGRKVVVTEDREAVRGCRQLKRLHEFTGDSMWGTGAMSGRAERENEIEMMNETAKAGGNVLLLTSSRRGEALLCPSEIALALASAPLPTPAPE